MNKTDYDITKVSADLVIENYRQQVAEQINEIMVLKAQVSKAQTVIQSLQDDNVKLHAQLDRKGEDSGNS